jgi:hypothetical protein
MKLITLFEAATYPKTWYHGSNHKITKFTTDFMDTQSSNGLQNGPGIYFTSDINDAKIYGKYIHEVTISIAKSRLMPEFKRGLNIAPIILHNQSNFIKNYQDWDKNYSKAYITALKTFDEIYDNKNYRNVLIRLWEDFYFDKSNIFLKEILGKYDGYILEYNNGVKHFMCYKPEIIKSIKVIDPESHQ